MIKRLVFVSLFLAVTLLTWAQNTDRKELTLEDIWKKPAFSSKVVSGLNSMKDGKHYSSFFTDAVGKTFILQYNYATGKVTDTILSPANLVLDGIQIDMDDYQFSSDEKLLLISSETEPVYRRSTKALNYIFDRRSNMLFPLSDKDKGKQQFATFSPDGKKVAFMRDNDLYLADLYSRKETRLTSDGKWNHIINGGTDWVYEEEFEFARAFFWSPDGKKIAFYRFDETNVKQFSMAKYNDLYPEEYKYKYPKAGEENAVVSIHMYDLESGKTVKVDVGPEKDQYIPRIKWTADPLLLCVLRMNRLQNKLEYLLADPSGKTRILLTEESQTYVEVNDDLIFLQDGKSFLISSERNGYRHLYLYNMNGKLTKQVTSGNWDVTSLYGVDEKNKLIYYQSAEGSPLRRDVYVVKLDGSGKNKLSTKPGTNDAVFSADYSNFINYHTDANTPLFITLNDRNGVQMRVLENNTALREKLAEYKLPRKEFISIPVEGGIQLNAWMIKPADFDPKKKYPVFMFVYGGPGSQTVTDSWGGQTGMWYHYLASKGYLVVSVDNRGTGARGADFKKMTYLELGKYETIDQIGSAKWLAKQPYVDGSRIGIQGWSYGGYMSSLCITKGADVFKMAIAVAPVTTWRYYDSIYTERYLRTPQQNAKGYDENSPINFVDQLKGAYLIVHGTADDNVHFQNSVEMVDALIKAGKKFESAYYPDKHHSISGSATRYHLYSKMTDFIMENL